MEKLLFFCLFCAHSVSLGRGGVENDLYSNADPPVGDELPWTFYKTTCPKLESIVMKRIKFYLEEDITQATELLCLHFHDCFVQGCDAWVLLNGLANEPSEEEAPPNLTLLAKAFEMINDIKKGVELDKACRVVSCSDIAHLVAPDFVLEKSIDVMDRMFKGRKLLQRHKLQPQKPKPDHGRDPQHDCIGC